MQKNATFTTPVQTNFSQGVGLRAEPVDRGRIFASSGTQLARSISGEIHYAENAWIPLGPWRPLSDDEIRCLETPAPLEPVRVLKLYDRQTIISLQGEIESLRQRQLVCPEPWDGPFLTEILGRLADFGTCRELVSYHPILSDPVDLETVSQNSDTKLLVGLHIDMWARTENAVQAKNRPSRLCLNLGCEDRWFLFINQPVDTMKAWLGDNALIEGDANDLGRAFMCSFPAFPVLKLRIQPGEAYVAATEMLLHDGASTGQTTPVFHTAVRGYFDFLDG